MEPITFRAPADLLDELAEEADALGFSSRSEYMRHLLRDHGDTGPVSANRTDTEPATQDRLDEMERRIEILERELPPTAQNRSESSVSDSSPERTNTPSTSGEIAGSGWVGLGEHRERIAVDDELRNEMETTLEGIQVPGRKSRVGYKRREAIKFAWDLLRDAGEAESRWLANSTFAEFFDDDDLKYSTSGRYPGYQMWDGCVRPALKQLPGVESPEKRGSTWRFDPEGVPVREWR